MFKGIAASPGIAIGPAWIIEEQHREIPRRQIKPSETKQEVLRFRQALGKARQKFLSIKEKVAHSLGTKHSLLFDAYNLILEDEMLRGGTIKVIVQEQINAEAALEKVTDRILKAFSQVSDQYISKRGHDVVDVSRTIMSNLLGSEKQVWASTNTPSIIVAHNLTPADTIDIHKEKVVGFVTDVGGATSHTAILARSLGIPAVVGMKDITRRVATGDTLIVDGIRGIVIINPEQNVIDNYTNEKVKLEYENEQLAKLKDLPATTLDGRTIEVFANIELPSDVTVALNYGATGIGLFRTEYAYLDQDNLPGEEDLYHVYSLACKRMLPYSVVFRTLDLGIEKVDPRYMLTPERNPYMGLRGIRLCLANHELFKTQLKAILRAAVEGNASLMYPMIATVEEFRQAQEILEQVKEELRKDKVQFDENIQVGMMVETPAAALSSDVLARECAFFSIGTNDLVQYTMAVDRVNENVAYLYEPYHPAVLKMIRDVIRAGHHAGIPVSMCGEMAGDPALTKLLIGLGIDQISMNPHAVPTVKQHIREIKYEDAQTFADEILTITDIDEIRKRLNIK